VLLCTGALLLLVAPVRAQPAQEPQAPPFAASRDVVPVGEEVSFAVIAPQPGRVYVWQFGDGSPPVTGPRVTHRYAAVNDFTVRLSVQEAADSPQALLGARIVRVTPEFRGVFASDWDNQFTPADLIQMAVVVRAPGLNAIDVRTGGALIAPRSAHYELAEGDNFLILEDMRIADEQNPIIQEELLRRPGASIPLRDGMFTLALDYVPPSSGQPVTLSFTPEVKDFFNPERGVAVTYPHIADFAGLPEEGAGEGGYYLTGDADFSHTTDYYVRLLALQWGRRGGPWPDDPQVVAMNLYRSIDATLGDGEPGEFNNDYNLARLFADGTLSMDRKNGSYICIAQVYLLTALARTLGVPAREINNAIAEPLSQRPDGVWRVRWWQEAGAELWYNGGWHYFDPWYGATSREDYLVKNLAVQSWYAFNAQRAEFYTMYGQPTGLRGHNFNAWPGDPPQWRFLEQRVRPGVMVEGIAEEPAGPSTMPAPSVARIAVPPFAPASVVAWPFP
jgi:hypothetical protein